MNPSPPDTPSEEAVRARARALWKAAGSPGGQDLAFWLNAENKLRDELAAEYDALVEGKKQGVNPPAHSSAPARASITPPAQTAARATGRC